MIISPLQQVIDQAETELSVLQHAREEWQAKLAAVQAEMDTLHERARARAQQVATAAHAVTMAQAAYAQAQAHTQLAQGTPLHEEKATQQTQAQTQLDIARREHVRMIEHAKHADDQDSAREADLNSAQAEAMAHVQEIEAKHAAMQQARAESITALSEATYAGVAREVERAQAHVTELEKQLAAAEEARETIITHGLARLEQWPAQAKRLKRTLSYHDTFTHVAEEAIRYIDALVNEAGQAEALAAPYVGSVYIGSLYEVLTMAFYDVSAAGSNITHPLLSQKERLQQLLETYRQEQRH